MPLLIAFLSGISSMEITQGATDMPSTQVQIPESLGQLLEPFRYLGHLGKNETEAARYIRSGNVQYKPRIILDYDAELAFYTTDESLEAMSDIGDCPVYGVLLYDKTNSSANMPSSKEYKRIWKSAFKLALAYLRTKGIEGHWDRIALHPLWVSSWSNVESIYYDNHDQPSKLLLDSTEQHASISGCSVEQMALHRKLVAVYSKNNFPYLFPDERIAKHYGAVGIYDLTVPDLRDLIGKIEEGRMFL